MFFLVEKEDQKKSLIFSASFKRIESCYRLTVVEEIKFSFVLTDYGKIY